MPLSRRQFSKAQLGTALATTVPGLLASSTFEHCSFELADVPMIFKPQTDLVILNYIANHLIESGAIDRECIDSHTRFARGVTDIGYGLRPEDPRQRDAANTTNPNQWTDTATAGPPTPSPVAAICRNSGTGCLDNHFGATP